MLLVLCPGENSKLANKAIVDTLAALLRVLVIVESAFDTRCEDPNFGIFARDVLFFKTGAGTFYPFLSAHSGT